MAKRIIQEELFRNEESEMSLDSLELAIGWIKVNCPDHFGIRIIPEADYDGLISGIVVVGERWETDKEMSTREGEAKKIGEAFEAHDRKMGRIK